MSDVVKKEKKEKKAKKEAKEAPVAAASAAMAKQDDGLHIKSEAVTKAIDTKDWPLLLKVRRGESVERAGGVHWIVAQRRRDCGPPLLTVCRRCLFIRTDCARTSTTWSCALATTRPSLQDARRSADRFRSTCGQKQKQQQQQRQKQAETEAEAAAAADRASIASACTPVRGGVADAAKLFAAVAVRRC